MDSQHDNKSSPSWFHFPIKGKISHEVVLKDVG